jgi:Flp pilus assembly protein TadG
MSALSVVGSLARRFAGNNSANVAIIFALATIPFVIAVGTAVDFARGLIVQTRMQSALDAAALSAAIAGNLTDEERIALGEQMFAANYQPGPLGGTATPSFSFEDGVVVASVDSSIDTTLMNVAGITELSVGSSTEISIPGMLDAEIALVLDYSGSMNRNGKYQAMREAAISLVETLSDDGESDRVQFGLVPFSHHVYTTLPEAYVAGETGSGTWTGCTYDRMYPYNTEDTTPDVDDEETQWGIEVPGDPHNSWGCNGYASRSLIVQPLTFDYDGVVDQLEDMTPYAWTNIALGMAFGWHLLSPNAPYSQGASYGDDVLKAIVLLTDGRQTQRSWGPGGSRSVANGEANLEEMCESANDAGVLVITVAFDLQDDDTEDRLRECASEPQFFYIADNNAELASSFNNITNQLASAIYVSQ